jgi:hypothetical protein
MEEDGEVVDLDGAVESGEAAVGEVVEDLLLIDGRGDGGGGAEDGEPAEWLAGLARCDDWFEHHDEDAGDGEDYLGEQAEEVGGH